MLSLWFAYSRFASKELIPDGFLTVFFVYIDLCWPNFSCYQSW
ncbi:hypothetical protein Hanom_Chr03g00230821 [Helianthus anomalus]